MGECVVQRENSLNTVTKDQNDVRTGTPAGIISGLPETRQAVLYGGRGAEGKEKMYNRGKSILLYLVAL